MLFAGIAALVPQARGADALKIWDAGTAGNNNFYNSGNWNPDGTPTFTGNTDAIVFNGAQASGNPTIVLNINGGLTSYLVKSFTFGSDPLNNSYSFAYTFNGPQSLILGDATTGATTQANTGYLINNSTGTQTFNLASNASTVLPFQVGISFGGINAAVGNIVFGANAKIDIGNESNAAGRGATVTGAANTTFNGTLLGLGDDTSAGGTLTKTGTGTLFLNGDSTTWNGRIVISEGTVQVNKTNSLGTAVGRTTISGGSATGRLAITGGINLSEHLYLGGRTSGTSPHVVNVSGSNTLITGPVTLESGGNEFGLQSDGGTLQVLSPITYGTATGATTLNLLGAGNGNVASNLPAQPLSIFKSGAGTWTLSGPANAYTGTTTVNQGRLNISTTQSGGGALVINDGGTLGVTVAAAGQTLTTSSLTLGSSTGGTVSLDLGTFGNPTNPVVTTNALVVNGASTIGLKAGGLALGQFPLIDYSGTIGGAGFAGLALGGLPARISANLLHDEVGTRVLLNVTAYDVPKWIGGVNGDWDIDDGTGTGTANWREAISGNVTRYLQGGGGTDSVLFDDTAGVPTAVNLTATLTPASVTVNASSNAFTFTGSGSITGGAGLLKQGTSTLTLINTGANTYTGSTTISAGAIQLGDGATLAAGTLGSGPVVNQGTLIVNRPDAFTIANELSGNGALQKLSGGTLTLSGNNSGFTGAVSVDGGTLRLASVNALSAAGSVVVHDGAALDVNARATGPTTSVALAGAGPSGTGVLVNTGTGAAGVGVRNAAFTADVVLGGTGRFDIGGATGVLDAGGFKLTKAGTNTVFLSGLGETHLGNIVINAGRLSFSGNTTFGDQPGVVTLNGAELGFEDSTAAATKPIQFNGGRIVFPNGDLNEIAAPISLLDINPITQAEAVNTFQGVATLKVSGVISGPGSLTKTNSGLLILTGNNTYAGVTNITGGVLRANEGAGLTTNAVIIAGAVLESGSNILRGLGVDAGQISLGAGNGGFSAAGANITVDLSGANTGSGFTIPWGAGPDFQPGNFILNQDTATHTLTFVNNIDFNGASRTINVNGSTSIITGVLSGDGVGLTKGGAGTLVLNAANSYTAGTTVSGGTLRLGNANALGLVASSLTVNSATVDLNGFSQTFTSLTGNTNGIITDLSAGPGTTKVTVAIPTGSSTYTGALLEGANGRALAFEKSGAGTLIFNKANAHTYSGGTVISGGRLEVRTNNAQVLPLGTPVTFNDTATFVGANNTASATASITLGALHFAAGEGTVESWRQNATATSGLITFAAAPTRELGATGRFTLAGTTPLATFKVAFATAPQAERSLNGGLYFGDKDFAAYDGNGFVRPINYPADAGALDVALIDNAATFGAAADKDVQLSGGTFAIQAQGPATLRTLKISGSHNITLEAGATLTLSSGGLIAADGTATISGGAGITTGGAGDLVTRVAGSGDQLILDTAIAASTTGGLTKSGAGSLNLNATNAFTGGVTVVGGSLVVGDLGSILNGGTVNVHGGGSLLVNGALSGVTSINVKDGATLGGTGTISGAAVKIAEGGLFDPSGDINFALGSSSLDLSATAFGGLRFTLGSSSDRVVLSSGTLSLGSGFSFADFSFTDAGSFAPGSYVLFDTNADILGDLGSATGTVLGLDATLSFANGANGHDDLILTVVPEPSSAILLLGGLGFLAAPRRRGRPRA